MQLGIFTVGDVTPDPTTGRTPTEHERIKATIEIAKKAEEVGLDGLNGAGMPPCDLVILDLGRRRHRARQTEIDNGRHVERATVRRGNPRLKRP